MNKKWIFTFGSGQAHENGYAEVFAPTSTEARQIMHVHYGVKWSMQYDSEHEAGVERFGLRKVSTLYAR